MKHLLLVLCTCFLLLLQSADAQDVKTKAKTGKAKTKEQPASTATGSGSVTSMADASAMKSNDLSLTNTSWKTYVGDPLNDTVIIHYSVDAYNAYSQKTKDTLVSGSYKVAGDTLTIHDVSGEHSCPSDMVGKYHLVINGDTMKQELINDECDGRGAVLKELSWQRAKESGEQ
jgi:hypothetical protein